MIRALLIDDDPIQLRLAELLLRRSAAFERVTSFTSAEDALAFLSSPENRPLLPDAILLDLNMPVVDGWTFLDRYTNLIPTLNKEIGVFIVSSSIDENDILRSKSFPFVRGFISKPINLSVLEDIASQLA